MSLGFRSITDADFKGKRVLLRVDFNVPLKKDGSVADATRIREALPTINYLLEQGAKVIILTHLGRPEGKKVESLKLDKVAEQLQILLGKPVKKIDQCFGPEAEQVVGALKNGQILMLENVRFWPEEEKKDAQFSKKLAALGDVFVSDAFGVIHRDQASVTGIPEYLPAYAGLLLTREIEVLSKLMNSPEKPLSVVIGGAKMETKIGVIKGFIHKADYFLLGGGIANTFLAAAGYQVAASLYEPDKIDWARELMLMVEQAEERFILPRDVVVASDIGPDVETLILPIQDVSGDMKILDMGPMTLARYSQVIQKSKTIIWNGPLGLFENDLFANGTRVVAREIADSGATTIVGGGDSIEAIKRFEIPVSKFSHVSTGGGAMLEYLEGKELPGLRALQSRSVWL